jgi:hypothetical protein
MVLMAGRMKVKQSFPCNRMQRDCHDDFPSTSYRRAID